jgi:hypothetical protein
MSAPVTLPPGSDDRRERLEAAFLRSSSATWPPPPARPTPVEVPRSWIDDDDEDGSEPGMTLIRTRRYCCR